MSRRSWILALGFGFLTAPTAYAQHVEQAAGHDLVETAVAAGQFTTLVKAVQAADLVTTLQGEGPFTVFAPTDAAFAKLPAGALDQLLSNPDQLKAVLLYHVVPGRVTAEQVTKLDNARTAQGGSVPVRMDGSKVTVGGAEVVTTDIAASNGIIHVIDTVMLPPTE